jgi:hypothetical protein
MRTNKACPLYQNTTPLPPMVVALTEEQEEEIEKQIFTEDEELVNVDGTKVKLSGKLVKHAEEVKRRSLVLKGEFDSTISFFILSLIMMWFCYNQYPRMQFHLAREDEPEPFYTATT